MSRYVVGAVVCVTAIVAASWYLRPSPTAPRSVAVLPFQDVGTDVGSAYFTDGLHDSVIGHLSRIKDLRVISRTSVMPYREQPAGLAQIARELNVSYVVEGSVQRLPDQIRVTVQLSNAVAGTQLWSVQYDRSLADVFAVQADVARQIASAIDAGLTPEESAQLDQVLTGSLEAYDLYLQALEVERQQAPDRDQINTAILQLERAITLDPEFASAHALMSRLHMIRYWLVGDYDASQLPIALRHAEAALNLAPDRAEPYLAMALHWFWGHRDYLKALGYLKGAYSREPGNAFAYHLSGQIERRFGRWDEALSSMEKASSLDPRNPRVLQTYAVTLSDARRYPDAEQVLARLSTLAPGSTFVVLSRVRNRIRRAGDIGDLAGELRAIEPGADPYCLLPVARYHVQFQQKRFREAADAVLACAGNEIGMFSTVPAPEEQFSALAFHFAGDPRAREHARTAQSRLQERLEKRPDLPVTRMGLAYMLAILDDREGAARETERALGDARDSEDAVVEAEVLDLAAALHALFGEHERALEELERALELPNGSYRAIVRQSPFWDSLRSDPRFRNLVGTGS